MDEARRQKLAEMRERLTKRLAGRVSSERKLVPVQPRYDEVFRKGTAWLNSMAGGPSVDEEIHQHKCSECGTNWDCDWECNLGEGDDCDRTETRCVVCRNKTWIERRRRYAGDHPTIRALVELHIQDRLSQSDADYEDELLQLLEERTVESEAASPYPSCCQALIDSRAVYLGLPDEAADASEPWKHFKPEWRLTYSYTRPHKFDEASQDTPVAFCPFCGTRLPLVRRKAHPPQPLCVIEDGSYRCSTCGEDYDCYCYPPWAAYEIVVERMPDEH